MTGKAIDFEVTPDLEGQRVDAVVAVRAPVSRSQAQRWIDGGLVQVDGEPVRPSHRLRVGERVSGSVPAPVPYDRLAPEPIPLDVRYEDEHLIVVDKPAGLVVHPAPGHATGTLVHALLYHCTSLSGVGGVLRPGIVHRLDKGTSGLIVSAKSDVAHGGLAAQFHAHSVAREYAALVRGAPREPEGVVEAPIGRHARDGKRFSTRGTRRVRSARTRWEVAERRAGHCLLRVRPETGRTHQIRVHLASIGLPIVGDPVYGGGRKASLGLSRQALHAAHLGFEHPVLGSWLEFESGLPADLERAWGGLEG